MFERVIQQPDGLWIKTVFKSGCSGFHAPVASARWKQCVLGVCSVLGDVVCPLCNPGVVNVLK